MIYEVYFEQDLAIQYDPRDLYMTAQMYKPRQKFYPWSACVILVIL